MMISFRNQQSRVTVIHFIITIGPPVLRKHTIAVRVRKLLCSKFVKLPDSVKSTRNEESRRAESFACTLITIIDTRDARKQSVRNVPLYLPAEEYSTPIGYTYDRSSSIGSE